MADSLESRIESYMRRLCVDVPDRHVGGPGNRAATEMFSEVCRSFGFEVETAELPCLEWESGESELSAVGRRFTVNAGPYSLPFDGSVRLSEASTVDQLEDGDFAGTVLLLHGPITAEQLMPKNYVFYNPDSHRRIVAAVEAARPAAVIAATGINPELAGGAYPFPLFEDGDFDIPNAFITDVDGEDLLTFAGSSVELRIDSRRIGSIAEQPVARKSGTGAGRILLMAHIDSKDGTPGALDNGTGVAALLGAVELLSDHKGSPSIEIWPFNGEDYYAATGQMYFLRHTAERFDDIVLGINVDGAGYLGDNTAVSLYGVGDDAASIVRAEITGHGFIEGPQWPQGDHSMLSMNGAPVVAVTSENVFFLASTIAHTPEDTVDKVDHSAVAEVARFLAAVAKHVGELSSD